MKSSTFEPGLTGPKFQFMSERGIEYTFVKVEGKIKSICAFNAKKQKK